MNLYIRSYSPAKTSIVVPKRNLTFERRNLYYKESYHKYKHYFEKPMIESFSTYIDYLHDIYFSKLLDSRVEVDRIKYIKRQTMQSDNFSFRYFIYDLYYDFFLNVELFFPYYDLYNIFAFLF